jgi:hypothetical protein
MHSSREGWTGSLIAALYMNLNAVISRWCPGEDAVSKNALSRFVIILNKISISTSQSKIFMSY